MVGRGNPGAEYAMTRHNVGFRVLDHLAEHLGLLFRGPSALKNWTGPRGCEWASSDADPEGDVAARWLLKPGTYMNRSGEIVAPVARWLARGGVLPASMSPGDGEVEAEPTSPEPAPGSILVVYDAMDLDVGELRLRPHGGHGGLPGGRGALSAHDAVP